MKPGKTLTSLALDFHPSSYGSYAGSEDAENNIFHEKGYIILWLHCHSN
jgi:hypothetical protein